MTVSDALKFKVPYGLYHDQSIERVGRSKEGRGVLMFYFQQYQIGPCRFPEFGRALAVYFKAIEPVRVIKFRHVPEYSTEIAQRPVGRMAFSLTISQMRHKFKTETRRNIKTWKKLVAGDYLIAIEKGQGLKKGETQELIGLIRIYPPGAIKYDHASGVQC